ncbi:MAG: superoxide dismutase [Bacteroidales bacterium]
MKKLMMILAIAALPFSGFSQMNNNKKDIAMTTINKLEFHNLPYAYDALEPFIDKMTMEIHHSKHHKAYYDNMMNAVKGTEMESKTIEEVFANMSKYPAAVRNNGGGYYNHNLYWEIMKVNGGKPSAKLETAIMKTFGSMDELKKQFTDAGKTRFGSGWAWLSVDKDGNLFVSSTPNQDNPLMDVADKKGTPILGMDVWEHAYYLKYQNKRPDYTEAFWSVINWEAVSKKYDSIVK